MKTLFLLASTRHKKAHINMAIYRQCYFMTNHCGNIIMITKLYNSYIFFYNRFVPEEDDYAIYYRQRK